MTAEVGDLPDALDTGGGQLGGEGPAEQGAAAVALAVGADEGEGVAGMGRAAQNRVEAGGLAAAECREVRSSRRAGSVVVAVCSLTLPGTVWATYTRRVAGIRLSA